MALYKRGATWWLRFSYDGKQVRRSLETEDKKLAERISRKILGQVAEGKWFERLPGEDMSFAELKEKNLKEHSPKKSPKQLHNSCADWLKPIVMVAYHTGMWRENILSLIWDQVDLFRRVITLEHTKNGDRLSIPINDTLMELFKSLSKVRHIRSPYVFCHQDGQRFKEIKKAFRRAIDTAKISNFKFHDLRHCFASSLVQKGADLYEVQRLLGHKDSRMTQRYAHLAPENLRKAVLKLDKVESEETVSTNLAQSGS